MRPLPVVASALALAALLSSDEARSDATTPAPTYAVWNRPNGWTVTTSAKKPPVDVSNVQFGETTDGSGTALFSTSKGVISAAFECFSTGTGLSFRGAGGFPTDGGAVPGTFAVKIVDTVRYESFKGLYFAGSKRGVPISGTYRPGPVEQETGKADLLLSLYGTRAATHPGKTKVTSVKRSKLPARLAFIGAVQNLGPSLLPRGVARMRFLVSPGGHTTGVTLPYIYRLSRVIDPATFQAGDVTDTSWRQIATIGALGRKADRAVFGFEIDVPKTLDPSFTTIHCRFDVESNSPLFDLSSQKDVKSGLNHADWDIAITND